MIFRPKHTHFINFLSQTTSFMSFIRPKFTFLLVVFLSNHPPSPRYHLDSPVFCRQCSHLYNLPLSLQGNLLHNLLNLRSNHLLNLLPNRPLSLPVPLPVYLYQCDHMIQTTAKGRLCAGVKTSEFDKSSVLRCRTLESILSSWKRSRDNFLGCSFKHICGKLQWVFEMKFRQLYDLSRTYRATLNPWFQTYFSLRFHHSYASYRPI